MSLKIAPASKKPSKRSGISALPAALALIQARSEASAIFSMVTEERGTLKELRALVNHASVLELIDFCVDLAIRTRPTANGIKSRKAAIHARGRQLQLLHGWLDRNIGRYKGRLDLCATDALKIKGLGRSYAWIRREISAYRASRPAP